MKLVFAADHAGFELKEKLMSFVRDLGYETEDMGAGEYNNDDDYPVFISRAARAVAADPENTRGVVLGGSGQGEAMVANRFFGVRAAVYYGGERLIIPLSREHNNANILALGARFVSEEEAKEALRHWLETPFPGEERHVRRIKKIDNLDL